MSDYQPGTKIIVVNKSLKTYGMRGRIQFIGGPMYVEVQFDDGTRQTLTMASMLPEANQEGDRSENG
jgi:hypothetical protein